MEQERHQIIVKNVVNRYQSQLRDAQDKHAEAVRCLEEIRKLTNRVVNGEWMPEVLYIYEVEKVLKKYFGKSSY